MELFVSKLGCKESRGNHSLTSKCRFKNLKIHQLRHVLEFQTLPVVFLSSLFLADLDTKYRNEIEMEIK